MGLLPPLAAVLTADISNFQSKMGIVKGEMASVEGVGNTAFAGLASLGKVAFLGLGAAAIGGSALALKMGGDFEMAMKQLVTGAGEVDSNLGIVSKGILKMAGETGTSTTELAKGMYMVESAGYHGAAGLDVLRASVQGAKVDQAQMATVANAVTSALNAYHLKSTDAVMVTNTLGAAVGVGKMHMEDLAGSLGTVLPAAAAAHIGLSEVTGALATMTMQGTSADNAATYLRQTILNLSNPLPKARLEMQGLGLSAIDVSMHLGDRGLAGTLTLLTDAIKKKMGPEGIVLIETLQKAAKASADHSTATQKMTTTATGWIKTMTESKQVGDNLHTTITKITDVHGKQTTAVTETDKQTKNFTNTLLGLPPKQQTYISALATMVGGTKSMQAALELTGEGAKVFQGNVDSINAKVKAGGNSIRGWAEINATLNQRIAQIVEGTKAWIIQIGTVLIPVAIQAMDTVAKWSDWLGKHKDVVTAVAFAVGTVLVIAIGAYTISMVSAAVATIAATWPLLAIIAVVAGLAYGLSMAYQHVKWFHDAVDAVAGFIKGTLIPIFGTLVGAYINVMAAGFRGLANEVAIVWNALSSFANFLKNVFTSVLSAVTGPLTAIGNLIGSALNPHKPGSPTLVQNVESGVAAIKSQYASLAGIKLPGLPTIGGISAGAGGLGGAGIPAGGGYAGGGGGVNVTVVVQGNVLNWNDTAQQLAEPIRAALLQKKRSTGNLGLA